MGVSSRRIVVGSISLLVAAAAWLRLKGLGSHLLFQDELHGIVVLTRESWGWILTHLGRHDHCIPLTLWAKWIAENHGLGEWAYRLPGAVAGIGLVGLTGWASMRLLRPSESVLLTALVALSPHLIYLSGEARPYPIVLMLFLLACLLSFAWAREEQRWMLMIAGSSCVLAVSFHPIVSPSCAVLALFILMSCFRRGCSSARRKDVVWSALLVTVLAALLLAPARSSLLEEIGFKSGKGAMTWETVRYGLMLLHGTGLDPPVFLWPVIWAVGAWRIGVRYPTEIAVVCAMLGVQLSVVWYFQPFLVEIPWIWLRYLAHLIPFLLAFTAVPLAWLLDVICRKVNRPFLGYPVAASLAVLLFTAHVRAGRYGTLRGSAYRSHPFMAFLPRDLRTGGIMDAQPAFYSRLKQDLPAGALIEAPLSIIFPIYGIYQREHGRDVYTGTLASGRFQSVFNDDRLTFGRIANLTSHPMVLPSDARFLIYHKRIQDEMSRMHRALSRISPLNHHLFDNSQIEGYWTLEYGPEPMILPASVADRFPRIYEDEMIEVYDLGAVRVDGESELRE